MNFEKIENSKKMIVTFGDNTTAKIYQSGIFRYSYLPNDLCFKYEADETNRTLVNDALNSEEGDFNLPEGMFNMMLEKGIIRYVNDDYSELEDKDLPFNLRLEKYIQDNFPEANKAEARLRINRLLYLTNERYIIENVIEAK